MAKRPVESDSDSSSSDSEVEVKKTTKVTKKVTKKAESSDSDSSDSEEEKPAKKATKKVTKKAVSSDSDSSDSEEEKPAKKATKATKKVTKKAESSDSDSSDSDSSDSEEKPAAKKAESSDSSDSDSSDSEEETPVVQKRKREEEAPATKKFKDNDGEAQSASQEDTVFVGGIPYDVDEDFVKSFFKKCGEINSIRMPTFPDSGRYKGIAFITFESQAAADAAVELNESQMGERYIVVKKADGRSRPVAEKKEFKPFQVSEKPEGCMSVFVGGLSFSAGEDELRAVFDSCGAISNARIAWDRENDRSKGFGYVDFEDASSVDAAVKLTGTMIQNRSIRVDYSAPRQNNGGGFGGRGGGRGGARGGRGGFGGDRGFGGGRGGGRGGFGGSRGGSSSFKRTGAIVPGNNKKMSFD